MKENFFEHKIDFAKIIVFFFIAMLIIPILLSSIQGPETNDNSDLLNMTKGRGKTSRNREVGLKNFTDFSNGIFYNTELNSESNIALTWQLQPEVAKADKDTLMLCNFDEDYLGEAYEVPTGYDKDHISLWHFEENFQDIIYDSTWNGNDGTVNGMTVANWTDGKFGKALGFDGINDYVVTPTTQFIGNEGTFLVWVKPNSIHNGIIGGQGWKSTGANDPTFYLYLQNDGKIQYRCSHNNGDNLYAVDSYNPNEWMFLAMTWTKNEMNLYKNGILIDSRTGLNIDFTVENQEFWFGCYGETAQYYFHGIIDEASVFKKALTIEEIKDYYNNIVSDYTGTDFTQGKFGSGVFIDKNDTLVYPVGLAPDSSCRGLWQLDNGSGSSIKDSSNNNNDGTWYGDSTGNWTEGRYGYGLDFDNMDDYVDIPDHITLDPGSGAWTEEAWVYWRGESTLDLILHKGQTAGPVENWRLGIRGDHSDILEFIWVDSTGAVDQGRSTGMAVPRYQWAHVAFTFDGSDNGYAMYINGIKTPIDLVTDPIVGAIETDYSLRIGNSQNDLAHFNGVIDDIGLFNRKKSHEDIYQDFLAGGQSNFNIHQGTIDMWVKPNWDGNDNEERTIFFSGDEWNNSSFYIYKGADNKLKFMTSDNQLNYQGYPQIDIANWNKDVFYHLVFTWDQTGNKQIFINGKLQSSATNNYMPTLSSSKMYIGSGPGAINAFNGMIDDFRISNKVRLIDEFCVHSPIGTYVSTVLDAGEIVNWDKIGWEVNLLPNTNLYLQTRISNDNSTWTNWTGNNIPELYGQKVYTKSQGETINAIQSRYLQWRAVLRSMDSPFTPVLKKVNVTWNRLPKATNVKLNPVAPDVNDDLVITYDYSDADGDPEGGTQVVWYVDRGVGFVSSGIDGLTLSSTWTAAGERWYCRITPNDGRSYGLPVNSIIVTITSGEIVRVQILPSNKTITAGESLQFSAKAFDSDHNEINAVFIWNVTGVGIIDQTGLFTAEIAGIYGISAEIMNITGYALVQVIPGSLNKVKILPENPNILINDIVQFFVEGNDSNGNLIPGLTANWSVTGGGIIDNVNGIYKAREPGIWEVNADVDGLFAKTSITILKGAVTRIELNSTSETLEIAADSELQLSAIAYDQYGNELTKSFIWWVENGSISSTGLFTPHSVGTWQVIVSCMGSEITASVDITVNEGLPEKLVIEPTEKYMIVGDSINFVVKCYDSKGNSWTVTDGIDWSITNPSLGNITGPGTFKASSIGDCIIQAILSNATGVGDDLVGQASITILSDTPPGPSEEELSEAQEKQKKVEELNMLLIAIIVILIIIILILVFLLLRSKSAEKPEEDSEKVGEGEEQAEADEVEEGAWELDQEPDIEEEEVIAAAEAEEKEAWKLVDEDESSTEEAPEEVYDEALIDKGKAGGAIRKSEPTEIKRKALKKEKATAQKESAIIAKKTSKRPLGKPKLHKLEKVVKCHICFGNIKVGLNVITCGCGKNYHENCASRVGKCPVCETGLKEPADMREESD